MNKLEIDLYLKAKKQNSHDIQITVVALVVGGMYVLLAVIGIHQQYFDLIAGTLIFVALTVRSGLYGTRVSTSELLELIENQISRNPDALKFIATKGT